MLRLRYTSALVLSAALLALPACDSSGNEETEGPTIEGEWNSEQFTDGIREADYAAVTLNFETDGSAIAGSGAFRLYEGGETVETDDLSLSGIYNSPSLDVTASSETNPTDLEFGCTVESESSMECNLSTGGSVVVSGVEFSRR